MKAAERPPLLGWIVAVLFLSGLAHIVYAFTGAFAGYGMYYPALGVMTDLLMFVALSLFWELDRWGLLLFALFLTLRFLLDLWTGAFVWWESLLALPLLYFVFFRARFS